MKKPRWNRCVVECRAYICKAESVGRCDIAKINEFGRCINRKTVGSYFKCNSIPAQKEALSFFIDKCSEESKWAGLQLSTME
jgi:hypothetical protein